MSSRVEIMGKHGFDVLHAADETIASTVYEPYVNLLCAVEVCLRANTIEIAQRMQQAGIARHRAQVKPM